MGAQANRLYPIVRELAAAGHEVTVATGMPNYPSGRVFPEYRGSLMIREAADGCSVVRTAYLTTPRNKSKLRQLISYLSFLPAVFISGIRAGKIDAVLLTAPPPFPILAAVALAKLRRAKFIFDVRDLWSDELTTYGGFEDTSPAVRLTRALEQFAYKRADHISCTTKSLAATVAARGGGGEKISVLPNGADLEIFRPLPARNEIADLYGLGDRFVVMYSGLFGIKHGLEMLLEAAEILRDEPEVVFFLLGNGASRDDLLLQVKDRDLKNVIIADERRVEEVPWLIARSDVCFAAVRPEPYPRKVISVKIFEYMACEKPVIGAVEGESATVIEESAGGIVVAPGDASAIAAAALALKADPERRAVMGKAGRRYVEKFYSRSAWAGRFERQLSGLLKLDPTASGHAILQSEAE